MLVSADVGDLSLEVRRLFEDLAKRRPDRRHMVSGECLPLLDVFETERTIDVVLDVPGITIESIRIMIKGGIVLVAGEKERLDRQDGPASFHLVERDFGRFARAVRLHVAIDAAHARAWLKDGELRILLPKIPDRRGREIMVPIATEPVDRQAAPA